MLLIASEQGRVYGAAYILYKSDVIQQGVCTINYNNENARALPKIQHLPLQNQNL